MDKKWLLIGLAVGALFLVPKKRKARNRIKALSGWVENQKNEMENMSINQLHKIRHENSNYVMRKEFEIKDAYDQYNNMKRGKMRNMLASAINTETYNMNQRNEIAKHADKLIDKYYEAMELQSKTPKQLTLFGSKRMGGIPKKESERLDSMKNYYKSFMPENKAIWKAMTDLGYTHGKDCYATKKEAKAVEKQYKNAITINEGALCYHVYSKPNVIPGLSEISLNVKKRCSPDFTSNKIRCRVQQPKEFRRFFTRTSTTPGVKYVMGTKNGKGVLQSVMFDNCIWNLPQAKHWFNKNITRLLDRDKKTLNLMDLGKGKMHEEDYFSPRQQEMFPKLRRELKFEPEDAASIFTVDPLETCLERKGWQLNKVKKLQDSISAKMTVDMFGKTEKLTGSEVMLQEQIDECLKRLRRNEPEQKALFGYR